MDKGISSAVVHNSDITLHNLTADPLLTDSGDLYLYQGVSCFIRT